MPLFGGWYMKTYVYETFMLFVGKKSGCKRPPSLLPSVSHPPAQPPGMEPRASHMRDKLSAISQQLVFTVFLITVAPEWTW